MQYSVVVEAETRQSNTLRFQKASNPVFILACVLVLHSYEAHQFTLCSLVTRDKQSASWNRQLQVDLIFPSFFLGFYVNNFGREFFQG